MTTCKGTSQSKIPLEEVWLLSKSPAPRNSCLEIFAFFACLFSIPQSASAQAIAGISPEAPPSYSVRDLGVNLSTTDISMQHVDLSVGSGEFPAKLDLIRTYQMVGLPALNLPKINITNQFNGLGPGSQHNLLAYFTCQACNTNDPTKRLINMTVVVLGKSYHFTGAGPSGTNPILTQEDDDGATMEILNPYNAVWTFRFTDRDGVMAIFTASSSYKYDTIGGLFAKYIEFSDGQFISFTYGPSPFEAGVVRLLSVKNSKGYGYSFNYGSVANQWARPGARSDPSLISSITAIKMTNAGQVNLATVSYNYDLSHNISSVTDPNSSVTRYQFDEYLRLTKVFQPINGSTSPSNAIGYLDASSQVTVLKTFYGPGAGVGTGVISDNNIDVHWSTPTSIKDSVGNTTRFFFSDPVQPDPISVTVRDPIGNSRYYATIFCATSPYCFVDPYFNSSPTTFRSELNKYTSYTYDAHGRILTRTMPENNRQDLTRDANGNVVQLTMHAKPGSGLADISGSAGYVACNASNRKVCNKPAYTIDAKGNRRDFQYDPASGLPLVSLAPADANNQRTITRYSYGTVAPGPVSVPADIAAPPAYVLTAKDECLVSGVTGTTIDFTYVCPVGSRRRTLYNYIPSTPASPSSAELASVIEDSDTVAATTQFTYDSVGNVVSKSDANGNLSFATYDPMRRPLFEIGADPDGASPLPRQIVRHVYDADGNEIRTEYGTGQQTNGSDFQVVSFTRRTFDGNDRQIKSEEVVP